LANGIWLICGCVSGFFHEALDPCVPESGRHRWLRAIKTCYTELFDPLCSPLSIKKQESDPFCTAVFMLWDMDSLAFAQTFSEFREDCFDILQTALDCQSDACMRSGLHGLGHWIEWAEHDGGVELEARLKACIDDFVRRYRWRWRERLRERLDRFLRIFRARRKNGRLV
jgi:hypothetical protein